MPNTNDDGLMAGLGFVRLGADEATPARILDPEKLKQLPDLYTKAERAKRHMMVDIFRQWSRKEITLEQTRPLLRAHSLAVTEEYKVLVRELFGYDIFADIPPPRHD